MVALNGARRTKSDHPALPMSVSEIVREASLCVEAGADGLHLHVRDDKGKHSLDLGLYQEALTELQTALPSLKIQITTEAVGQYSPQEQRRVVEVLKPSLVSISIAEMLADSNAGEIHAFYQSCQTEGIGVQHILYSAEDAKSLAGLVDRAQLVVPGLQLLFVLGRYTDGQQSHPAMLDEFLPSLSLFDGQPTELDWGLCAFGQGESACLKAGWDAGGKLRVGFENSLWNDDGSVAANNAERVAEIVTHCGLSSSL